MEVHSYWIIGHSERVWRGQPVEIVFEIGVTRHEVGLCGIK